VEAMNASYSSLEGVLFSKSQTALIQFPGGRAGSYSYTIPNSVTSIGNSAFYFCSGLTNVTIPNSVTSIGDQAFSFCFKLTAFSVEAMNASYSSLEGVLFNKSQTAIILFPFGRAGSYSYTIPKNVTGIGSSAFYYCSGLTNITIPNSVTSIGSSAFYACSGLTNATIPNSVTNIEMFAFLSCSGLRSLFFHGNAPAVGTGALGSPTVCYYLPGTSGWGETLGDQPAYLWDPAPQTSGPSFGVRTNRFGFNITGTANIPIVVEASTNLTAATWVPLQSSMLTNGLIYFSDPAWTNYPTRVYRIRSP